MNLAEIAAALVLPLSCDPDRAPEILGVAPLDAAGATDLSFVAEARHARGLATSGAAAVICPADVGRDARVPFLASSAPAADFARATRLFHARTPAVLGVHPTAVVDPSARLGRGASIGPYAVVGARVEIDDDVEIHAHCTIYHDVRIGSGTILYAGCVVREGTVLGSRCVLQPNVVLGSDGFGFPRRADGSYESMPQLGTVRLEDDVDVGAGSTVDRATFGATRIGRGTKIDNLVQIGHNCAIGEHCVLCAQVGLAGSTTLGGNVVLAGQVGAAGHLTIGDGAIATAQTGIPASVAPGALVSGYPAMDNREWRKSSVVFTRLPDMQRQLRRLEQRLATLERAAGSRTPSETYETD
jgi:UDP-3-O-[3-hydroxymyristoyl] glucosamine N-acyltransferase